MFCHLHEWLISKAHDTHGRLGWWTREHLSHCARCQRDRRQMEELATALSVSDPKVTPCLAEDVCPTGRHQRWRLAGAGLLLAAAITFAVTIALHQQEQAVESTTPTAAIEPLLGAAGKAGDLVALAGEESVATYEEQLAALTADARSLLDMAISPLPTSWGNSD
jgi:hypothetical protein